MKSKVIGTLFLIAVFFSAYFFLYNILGILSEPIQLQSQQQTYLNQQPSKTQILELNETLQYYPNMKFNHNTITYYIDDSCDIEKKKRMKEAMSELQKNVENIIFAGIDNKTKADITIICNQSKIPVQNKKYFVQGEGGPTQIVNTSLFFVIEKGMVILIYDKPPCKEPIVEIHELLHVFGFKHSKNKNSIMYPILHCYQNLTPEIISKLNELYSMKNLPDLYFYDISVSKHGMFLNFNAQIKNRGVTKAGDVELRIYAMPRHELIDEFDLGTIDYGGGKTIEVENMKIPFKTKYIKFEIHAGDELYKENNIKEFSIS